MKESSQRLLITYKAKGHIYNVEIWQNGLNQVIKLGQTNYVPLGMMQEKVHTATCGTFLLKYLD